jgi:hypothetical protein
MNKLSFLFLVAVFACASCRQAQTANTGSNIQSNSPVNQQNSNILVNSSTNILQNMNQSSQTEQKADPELLKQIEAQQLETADPRKASNRSVNGNNKTSGSSPRQTW